MRYNLVMWLSSCMPKFKRLYKHIQTYLVALEITIVALALKAILVGTTGVNVDFAFVFAAVIANIYFAGLGPGVLSLAILLLTEQVIFTKYPHSSELVSAIFIICEVIVVSFLILRLKSTYQGIRSLLHLTQAEKNEAQFNEKRFKLLVNSIDHLVVTLNTDLQFTEIYGQWLSRMHISRDSIIGHYPSEFFNRADADLHIQKMKRALTGETVSYEWVTKIDKKEVFFDITLSPILDDDGEVVGLIGTGKEITAYKEYQLVAEQLNKQISNVIESITNAFFALDNEWRFTYINGKAEAVLKKTAAELLGRNIWEQLPELTKTLAYNNYREALAKQTTIEFEEYYPVDDKWYQVNVYPAAEGLAVYYADITDRKRIEAELRRSEEKYRLLVEQVQDYAIIMLDGEGKIISWNVGAERLNDYKADEVMGENMSLLLPTEDQMKFANQSLAVAREKGKYFQEGWIVRKKGTRYWSSFLIGAIHDTDGHLLGYSIVIRDMTEQVESEKRKNEFISIASHELKTPLTSIKIFTQLLQKKLSDNTDKVIEHHIDRMNIQIDKIIHLVEDLLDISKIESGKLILKTKNFDLNELVNQNIEDFRYTTDSQIIVKEMGRQSIVNGDRDRIGQVIINLLSNAVKYSPNSERIIVRVKSKDEGVEFSVEDFGIGIPKSQQSRIFERFYRVNSPNTELFSGLGLGLYISAEIIHRHRGKIGFTSRENKGSTFYFLLPYANNIEEEKYD